MGQAMDGRGLGRKWGQWEEIVVLVLMEMKQTETIQTNAT